MTKAADYVPEQLGFPLERMGKVEPPVDTHAVRLELTAIVEEMQAARDHAPWDDVTRRHLKAVFPEKSKALPPEEAEFMRRWFAMEMARIELLMTA